MQRKKVDSRIKTLLENNSKKNHRSLFMVIGDQAFHQIVTLLYLLNKVSHRKHKSILWCYEKRLVFKEGASRKKKGSSSKKKGKKNAASHLRQRVVTGGAANAGASANEVFDLFLASHDIRFCYYKDVHKIVGQTFDALVLQDFEQLTPNVLSRCVETVSGQGAVFMLIQALRSLSQLYTLQMDIHNRLRTASHQEVVPRFNERFILSLASNRAALIIDDELNVLPTSSHARNIAPIHVPEGLGENATQLVQLKTDLEETPTIGPLVALTKTLDQSKAVLMFLEACAEKSLRATVALTAARGRGKSAALGLSIAGAIGMGYSNVFVTAPSPENLRTVFAFVVKGFDGLHYKEHVDYELVTSPEDRNAVVRINVFHTHRQTVQYVHPSENFRLAQAELLVIDEAAAIPLPWVRALCSGPYLVFMSSTVTGYEGTGRALSLKLLKELRGQASSHQGRAFRETTLAEPIRYAAGDPLEDWLVRLLCLDAAPPPKPLMCPHPKRCSLYYVNKDALFSGHAASESMLHELVGTFVASHYKNSPNDLMLLSDAPAHHVFVLLPPVDSESTTLPPILAAVHVALEGRISRQAFVSAMQEGQTGNGDLIPWILSSQFQEPEFAGMSGVRIVRIAVHPECGRMGYGSRALELLDEYYRAGTQDEMVRPQTQPVAPTPEGNTLLSEVMKPRQLNTALLMSLDERPAEAVDWIGASFGVTQELAGFWRRNGYLPMYTRLTPNATTGEHTTIVLKALHADWHLAFHGDYRARLCQLLSYDLRSFSVQLAITLLGYTPEAPWGAAGAPSDARTLDFMSPYDKKRLEAYAASLLDYHAVLDLLPQLLTALLVGTLRAPNVRINTSQIQVLIGMALQKKSLEALSEELEAPTNQLLAFFSKALRKFAKAFRKQDEAEAMDVEEEQVQQKKGSRSSLPLANSEYAVPTDDSVWRAALEQQTPGLTPKSISVAASKRTRPEREEKAATKKKATKKSKKKKRHE